MYIFHSGVLLPAMFDLKSKCCSSNLDLFALQCVSVRWLCACLPVTSSKLLCGISLACCVSYDSYVHKRLMRVRLKGAAGLLCSLKTSRKEELAGRQPPLCTCVHYHAVCMFVFFKSSRVHVVKFQDHAVYMFLLCVRSSFTKSALAILHHAQSHEGDEGCEEDQDSHEGPSNAGL